MNISIWLRALPAVLALAISTPIISAKEVAKPAGETKKETPKPYPLNVCIVSGDKLGEMGKPYVFVHEGQEIKLCCKSCKEDFESEPAKYLKKLESK